MNLSEIFNNLYKKCYEIGVEFCRGCKELFDFFLSRNKSDKTVSAAGTLGYTANDPAAPVEKEFLSMPQLPNPHPPYAVHGYDGQPAPKGSLRYQGNGVYISIAYSMNMVKRFLGWFMSSWPRTHMLVIFPRAGVQLNAYYDGASLKFFYKHDPKTNKIVYTCESADVVSHEVGHAILDAMRPDLWHTQALEILAFHESFGDLVSIFTALSHDDIISRVIKETKGDLYHHNIVSRVAEELGTAIHGGGALRNAINNFVYTPPERLPHHLPKEQLAGNPHSFSRLFTGAVYDMIVAMYQRHAQNMSQVDALALARDHVGTAFFNAIPHARLSPRFYGSMIKAMYAADGSRAGAITPIMGEVLSKRRMIFSAAVATNTPTFAMDSTTPTSIFKHSSGSTVRIGGVKQIKLTNEIETEDQNDLYDITIDVPNDHCLEYDRYGRIVAEEPVNNDEVLECAKSCLDYLTASDSISFEEQVEPEKEFSVIENKLQRNFICQHHEISYRIPLKKQTSA